MEFSFESSPNSLNAVHVLVISNRFMISDAILFLLLSICCSLKKKHPLEVHFNGIVLTNCNFHKTWHNDCFPLFVTFYCESSNSALHSSLLSTLVYAPFASFTWKARRGGNITFPLTSSIGNSESLLGSCEQWALSGMHFIGAGGRVECINRQLCLETCLLDNSTAEHCVIVFGGLTISCTRQDWPLFHSVPCHFIKS